MRNRLFAKTAALLLSILFLCGCSLFNFGIADPLDSGEEVQGENPGRPMEQASPADNVFSLNYDPAASINPLASTSETNLLFAPLVYETLFDVDESMRVSPTRLIKEYSCEDGTAWRLTINTEIKMHDGSLMTAQDVSYSIRRAMSSPQYRNRLGSGITSCGAYGDDLVIITLAKPNTSFNARLNIPIIKEGTIEEDTPPGTGPYTVNAGKTALEAFASHPDAKKLPADKIYLMQFAGAEEMLSAFEDSKIDLVVNDPNGMDALGFGNANIVRYLTTTNMHYIGFNTERLFFAAPGNRQSVTFAINREHIVTNIMGGAAMSAAMPVSPLSELYNANYASYFDFSPEKCKNAFKNSGVEDFDEDGKLEHMVTGIPMEINIDFIVNSDSASKIAAARDIADNLSELGITINVRELSWDSYVRALSEGDFDMYYGEVRLTADFDLSELLTSGGSMNYGKLRDETAAMYISEYLTAGDEDKLMKAELMCQYLVEFAPITAIAFEKQEVITHRGVISGMAPTQYNVFNKFTDWIITL